MLHRIIRILEALLRLLRQAGTPHPATPFAAPPPQPIRPTAAAQEQHPQVDPEWTERSLWLAMYGIDLGRRPARGAEGVA